jgi:hypothetical protein
VLPEPADSGFQSLTTLTQLGNTGEEGNTIDSMGYAAILILELLG